MLSSSYTVSDGWYSFTDRVSENDILELAQAILKSSLKRGEVLTSPHLASRYLQARYGLCERELFSCMFLDTKHRLIEEETLFYGTIDGASVHPREIVKRALVLNAAAIIIAHNHPSGVTEPSAADRALTTRIRDVLALVDIRLLDHVIVSNQDTTSLAERGLL